MSKLADRLSEDFKAAMKNKDKDRKTVIQMVRAAVLQYEKDEQVEATDGDIMKIVEKEIKKRRELITEVADQRPEAAEEAKFEISILEDYLPEQLDEAELREIIQNTVNEIGASSMKDMGRVMKEVLAKVQGQADGSSISTIVKEILG
ncbi:GatB/YqeY domain-containing protein [Fastidiosipila sanguinis]|uniref:Aspartyl-tRNA amidotransferase n=1 Tax=Fastidiosipila sanguinis TaxID=236753 RepID=A0A2S0KM18_9FIRM|nr:GatB/YqeY domain-containing protein [Fastidiosipila sanguinis]AVM42080.1 aspartyl-tRNA amidotransferase [Fastidiosipila sanguinis]